MKQRVKLFCPEVPETWRVSRNPFLNPVFSDKRGPVPSKSFTAFANAQGEPVTGPKRWMMACCAGNIPVTGQDLVVKEKLTERGLFPVEGNEIIRAERRGQFIRNGRCREKNNKRD